MYFDRIVIVTHCTSPIKVGATVDTAFLHTQPNDESRMEATPSLVVRVTGSECWKGKNQRMEFYWTFLIV